MDIEDDFLDEAPAVQARGKFEPKAKPKPKKGKPATVPPAANKVVESQSLSKSDQSVNTAENGLRNVEGSLSLATSAVVGTEESSKPNEPCSDFPIWRKDEDLDQDPFEDTAPKKSRAGGKFQPAAKPGTKKVNFASVSDAAQVVQPVDVADTPSVLPHSDVCDNSQFSSGKTMVEAADIFSELENLDPFLTQSSGVTQAKEGENSPDGINTDAFPANEVLTSNSVSNCGPDLLSPLETATFVASNNIDGVGESGIPDQRFDIPLASRISDMTEEVEAFPDMETDDIVATGQQRGKYKPKTRSQGVKGKPSASAPQSAVDEPVVHPSDLQFIASETGVIEDVTIPVLPLNNVLDHSSMDISDCMMGEPSSHAILTNEEQNNLPQTSNDVAAPSVDVPGMPEKVITYEKRRKNASTGTKASEKQKKKVTFAEEPEYETRDDHSIADESVSGSVAVNDGEDDDRDADQVGSPSTRKRAPRKPKKPVAENEISAPKRKRSNKEVDKPTKEPPKKFPHATRRRKRCVDKELLENDDIDFQRIAIKDLILLAEHKERIQKKEAKEATALSANQSTQNNSREDDGRSEEGSFASEQGQEYYEDQDGSAVQWNNRLFNYQTYMQKEPRARWSKPDTERFYEAIRQFGTDMSMIQQLFPGRTRHQIKLKYKNEERRHPMKINEAVASRGKDYSHFEEVIKQLQLAAAQENRVFGENDSTGMNGAEEVEDLAPETNKQEETTELKQDESQELENHPADETEVHSPKSDENEEDDSEMWDLYKNL